MPYYSPTCGLFMNLMKKSKTPLNLMPCSVLILRDSPGSFPDCSFGAFALQRVVCPQSVCLRYSQRDWLVHALIPSAPLESESPEDFTQPYSIHTTIFNSHNSQNREAISASPCCILYIQKPYFTRKKRKYIDKQWMHSYRRDQ